MTKDELEKHLLAWSLFKDKQDLYFKHRNGMSYKVNGYNPESKTMNLSVCRPHARFHIKNILRKTKCSLVKDFYDVEKAKKVFEDYY